ncbi:hypothetical protein LTR56_008644 [Elasticomyces elasticus]|nr:hypothetical protein LTR56_008644 [Elasticomyces elasticus]KAK3662249.1 hypothetical protein LTR22_007014 [Elasticomyces elasticus]KAK4916726.1 hypothetical protein LTR49_015294 [Elasticomyces elasticus]
MSHDRRLSTTSNTSRGMITTRGLQPVPSNSSPILAPPSLSAQLHHYAQQVQHQEEAFRQHCTQQNARYHHDLEERKTAYRYLQEDHDKAQIRCNEAQEAVQAAGEAFKAVEGQRDAAEEGLKVERERRMKAEEGWKKVEGEREVMRKKGIMWEVIAKRKWEEGVGLRKELGEKMEEGIQQRTAAFELRSRLEDVEEEARKREVQATLAIAEMGKSIVSAERKHSMAFEELVQMKQECTLLRTERDDLLKSFDEFETSKKKVEEKLAQVKASSARQRAEQENKVDISLENTSRDAELLRKQLDTARKLAASLKEEKQDLYRRVTVISQKHKDSSSRRHALEDDLERSREAELEVALRLAGSSNECTKLKKEFESSIADKVAIRSQQTQDLEALQLERQKVCRMAEKVTKLQHQLASAKMSSKGAAVLSCVAAYMSTRTSVAETEVDRLHGILQMTDGAAATIRQMIHNASSRTSTPMQITSRPNPTVVATESQQRIAADPITPGPINTQLPSPSTPPNHLKLTLPKPGPTPVNHPESPLAAMKDGSAGSSDLPLRATPSTTAPPTGPRAFMPHKRRSADYYRPESAKRRRVDGSP